VINSRYCFFIATSWNDKPVSQHFRSLAAELVNRGHRVVLLIDQQRVDVEDWGAELAVYTWPSVRPTKLKDAVFLRKLVKQYRPDCFIANFGATNIMLLVGKMMNIPCRVAWYRTLSDQINLDNRLSELKVTLLRFRKKLIYQLATHIVANSEATKTDLVNVYKFRRQDCQVFYNTMADPLEHGVNIQQPVTDKRIVCVGRHEKSKGQDVLIEAVALLKDIDVCVEFIGGGPATVQYKKLSKDLGVQEKVTFTGTIPHDEVLKKMASAYLSVVPSRSEAFGWVNIESLALGTPVVASEVGGIPEIIKDGFNGFLFPPGDAKHLAEHIRRIVMEPNLRTSLSSNARTTFLNKFEQKNGLLCQASWFEELVSQLRSLTSNPIPLKKH
jgi:glycosyltransferase involved in cell wall biosynthesis